MTMHLVRDKRFPDCAFCLERRPERWTVAPEKCECIECIRTAYLEMETLQLRTIRALEATSVVLGKYKRDMGKIATTSTIAQAQTLASKALESHGVRK